MCYSNKAATEIMIQIQNGDYSGAEKLYWMIWDKLKKIISNKHRVFAADWSEEDHIHEVFTTILEKKMEFDSTRAGFTRWLNFKEKEVYNREVTKHKMVIEDKDKITGAVIKDYIPYRCQLIHTNENNEDSFIIDEAKYSVMSAEDELIAQMTVKGIYEAINSLPYDYSQAIYLCDILGLKPAQAAEKMGCKPAVFYNKRSRAMKIVTAYAKREGLLDDRYAYDRKARVMDEHDEPDL